MVAIVLAVLAYLRIVGTALRDPAVRGLLVAMAIVLGIGTVSYMSLEGWSVVDALYFSVVSLLTVGYGDYVPTSDGAKLFTIGYLLTGVGIIASAATTIIQRSRFWLRFEPDEKEPGETLSEDSIRGGPPLLGG
jgi:voltage-gated potassium channel Kch